MVGVQHAEIRCHLHTRKHIPPIEYANTVLASFVPCVTQQLQKHSSAQVKILGVGVGTHLNLTFSKEPFHLVFLARGLINFLIFL